MRSMRSAQRQMELKRLGNQLPVLGKANLVCKIGKCCVLLPVCSAATLYGRPRRARDKKISQLSRLGQKVASRPLTSWTGYLDLASMQWLVEAAETTSLRRQIHGDVAAYVTKTHFLGERSFVGRKHF